MAKILKWIDTKWPRVTPFLPRIKVTLILLAAAFLLYLLAPNKQTLVVQKSTTESLTIEIEKLTVLLQAVSLFLVAFCLWLWRDVLKITGAFGMSWPDVTQQEPEDRIEDDDGTPPPSILQDIPSAAAQMQKEEDDARKQHVMELLADRHALNVLLVAHELGITSSHAKTILYTLTKEGKLRCDGFPKHSLYTQANSPENMAIDRFRREIEEQDKVLSERRYVRIRRMYELDAVLKTEGFTHLVEVKYIRRDSSPDTLNKWLMQLLTLSAQFPNRGVRCHLLLVAFTPELLSSTKELIERFTFDSGDTPTMIEVYGLEDLKNESQNKALERTSQ